MSAHINLLPHRETRGMDGGLHRRCFCSSTSSLIDFIVHAYLGLGDVHLPLYGIKYGRNSSSWQLPKSPHSRVEQMTGQSPEAWRPAEQAKGRKAAEPEGQLKFPMARKGKSCQDWKLKRLQALFGGLCVGQIGALTQIFARTLQSDRTLPR